MKVWCFTLFRSGFNNAIGLAYLMSIAQREACTNYTFRRRRKSLYCMPRTEVCLKMHRRFTLCQVCQCMIWPVTHQSFVQDLFTQLQVSIKCLIDQSCVEVARPGMNQQVRQRRFANTPGRPATSERPAKPRFHGKQHSYVRFNMRSSPQRVYLMTAKIFDDLVPAMCEMSELYGFCAAVMF